MTRTPYASLDSYLLAHPIPAEMSHEMAQTAAQAIWDTAYNAGIDAAKFAIDNHVRLLKSVPREASHERRIAQGAEISAVAELIELLPLYKRGQPKPDAAST